MKVKNLASNNPYQLQSLHGIFNRDKGPSSNQTSPSRPQSRSPLKLLSEALESVF